MKVDAMKTIPLALFSNTVEALSPYVGGCAALIHPTWHGRVDKRSASTTQAERSKTCRYPALFANRAILFTLFGAFAFSGLAQAEPSKLGRLFFTPDQRARMDVARQNQRSIVLEPEQETLPEPAPATVTLNGVIAPSNGRPMVWINGRLQEQGRAPSPVIMPETGRQVSVTSPDGSSRIPLKVGQSIDTSSGKVEEGWRPNPSATTTAPGEPDKNARP